MAKPPKRGRKHTEWSDLTIPELKTWLGLMLAMGIVQKKMPQGLIILRCLSFLMCSSTDDHSRLLRILLHRSDFMVVVCKMPRLYGIPFDCILLAWVYRGCWFVNWTSLFKNKMFVLEVRTLLKTSKLPTKRDGTAS